MPSPNRNPKRLRVSKSGPAGFQLEMLEDRKMLSGVPIATPGSVSDFEAVSTFGPMSPTVPTINQRTTTTSPSASWAANLNLDNSVLRLPGDLPDFFSLSFQYAGERLTLQLEKNSIYGENTRFLVDDGTGRLVEIDKGLDRSYLGTVTGRPEYAVSALLTTDGLLANIIRPNQSSITIEPVRNSASRGVHKISLSESEGNADNGMVQNSESVADFPSLVSSVVVNSAGTTAGLTLGTNAPFGPVTPERSEMMSSATLPPSNVMSVFEFEVGVEIGSRAFFASTAYNGNLATAQASAASIIGNMDARYLRAAGIKYKLGTVIIRTDANTDPLRNSVTATGAAANAGSSLAAFRDYWNSHSAEVGNTHDLAVYHVLSAPSGLAYVNSVGSSNRYATTGGNGPTSWADGTLVHEWGHSWNLRHNNDSGLFYESKPRNNAGSSSAGGSDVFVSVMNGSGDHNIGRLATEEAEVVLAARSAKQSFGTPFTPAPTAPFGKYDRANSAGVPVNIDVIANDYDVNNDVLDVRLLDTVSQQGATISLSVGTGPGGRNQIRYTPPVDLVGQDFFHYTVFDTTGKTDFGAVYVSVDGPTVIDLNQTIYHYDLGTPDSPVFTGSTDVYQRISQQTFGDLGFTSNGPNPVESRDRGVISGINDINRDHIRLRSASSFHHKLVDGVYDILLTIGDATETTAAIRFTAEDSVTLTTASQAAAIFPNYTLNGVTVTDGELNLKIENLGFSANITRLRITRTATIITVDTTETEYRYDLQPTAGATFDATYRPLTNTFAGDISFSSPMQAVDYGSASGENGLNRDGLFITGGSTTMEHKVANGIYNVLVTVGDVANPLDTLILSAEGGAFVSGSASTAAADHINQFLNSVTVIDGSLSLKMTGVGGVNDRFAATRIIITRIGNLETTPPQLLSFTRQAPTSQVTANDSVTFRATFNETVLNVSSGDFTVAGSTATVASVTPVALSSGTAFDIVVSGGNLPSLNGTIGLDVSAAQDITDAVGNEFAGAEPVVDQTYIIDNLTPQVAGVFANDNLSTSRSQITSVTVTFDREVSHTALQSAFVLTNVTNDTAVGTVTVNPTNNAGKTTAVLTFSGASTEVRMGAGALGNSLMDGDYRLNILSAFVRRSDTDKLMETDYLFGAAGVSQPNPDNFFRFYGDSNGDRTVNAFDLLAFRNTYQKTSPNPGYRSDLDFNGDGIVNAFDLLQFRSRYRKPF